jgi:transposase
LHDIISATMYVDSSTIRQGDKTYTRHLLRESYREGKKVKHRTIANLSHCSPEEIEAIRLALKHKKELSALIQGSLNAGKEGVNQKQGLSIGAVWLIADIARQLGISAALGNTREGKLALWQVIARVIDQGSRLSAVRLAGYHAACDIVGLGKFNEDNLYANLDWLAEQQESIEDRLFRRIHKNRDFAGLYLYDVTSSYFEGTENELAAFGYNRDKKKGKLQIVIGLLCNELGEPLSIEVFPGNSNDTQTLLPQVEKIKSRFGGGAVTMVGDRGMIKNTHIKEINKDGLHYITAITKPQIEKLLKNGVFQLELFEDELAEIETNEGTRYVLRRNPQRAKEIDKSRQDKLENLKKEVVKQNKYLQEHQRASGEVALRKVITKSKKLLISEWITATIDESRAIHISTDEEILAAESKLDGCYAIKTDLTKKQATKETVHNRYKDLALVETAFRTSKTVELEMRPINVRLESRTRGHVFVVMLAFKIVRELAKRWKAIDMTVEEGIKELSTLCASEMEITGVGKVNQIPEPRESIKRLLEAADVKLPASLPCKGIIVTTKKKLMDSR